MTEYLTYEGKRDLWIYIAAYLAGDLSQWNAHQCIGQCFKKPDYKLTKGQLQKARYARLANQGVK